MADVTISSLPLGTPSGSAVLPFSSGSSTSQVSLSSLYSNTIQTKPVQPAFAVKPLSITTYSFSNNLKKLNLDGVIFNQGNYWDTVNQKFIAPVGGIYSFSGMIRVDPAPTNAYIYPWISINGVGYYTKTQLSPGSQGALPGLTYSSNGTFLPANWHQLIKLDKNDAIELYIYVPAVGSYSVIDQSVFYGYLLG